MIYKKWNIILVSFPFTDLKSSKKRPALIISPDEYNQKADVIIAYITSKMDQDYETGDCHIKEWKSANLPKLSMIRMKFGTIDKTIIKKRLGRLSESDVNSFKKELSVFFDL
jgi:mRNA interferase MazF